MVSIPCVPIGSESLRVGWFPLAGWSGAILHHDPFQDIFPAMARQSITLTPPNDEWLRARVASEEYASKSEVVNDLIRKAREIEVIRAHLARAEASAVVEQSAHDMLREFKEEARRDGALSAEGSSEG